MRLKLRIGVVLALAVIVAVLAVLVVVRTGSRSVSVQDLAAKPDAFNGRVVDVEGTADSITPAVAGYRVFRLSDDASSVWVVSKLGSPADGARIIVHGRVATALQLDLPVIDSVNLGTFLVEERREIP